MEDSGVVYGQTKAGDATAGSKKYNLSLSAGRDQRLKRPEKEANEVALRTHVVEES